MEQAPALYVRIHPHPLSLSLCPTFPLRAHPSPRMRFSLLGTGNKCTYNPCAPVFVRTKPCVCARILCLSLPMQLLLFSYIYFVAFSLLYSLEKRCARRVSNARATSRRNGPRASYTRTHTHTPAHTLTPRRKWLNALPDYGDKKRARHPGQEEIGIATRPYSTPYSTTSQTLFTLKRFHPLHLSLSLSLALTLSIIPDLHIHFRKQPLSLSLFFSSFTTFQIQQVQHLSKALE